MLAVGPVAILPAPVLAALPAYNVGTNTGSFITTNGAVTSFSTTGVNGNGSATITTNDRTVLVWGGGNFNIGTGELFNFQTPIGGAVLNKVGYTTSGPDAAIISGNVSSGGRVFILANGSITVNGGANINTQGLFLSTLAETGDFAFTTSGNLSFTGASQGPITIGSGASQVQISSGSLNAWAGSVGVNNVTVAGDMLINTGSGLNLAGIGGSTIVTGNLSVITANSSVTQSRVLTVGGSSSFNTGTGSTTLNFMGLDTLAITSGGTGYTAAPTVTLTGGGGTGATATAQINTSGNVTGMTITSAGTGYTSAPTVTFGTVTGASGVAGTSTVAMNDFVGNVSTTTTGSVSLIDRNALGFSASTAGSLTAQAVGNVTTNGAVAVGAGGVFLNSFGAGNVAFNNGSSTTGVLSANVAGIGNTISINATGSLITGTLTTAGLALNSATVGSGGTGYTGAPTVTITGGGGSGGSATAVVNTSTGQVTVVGITSGTGYTSTPTLVFAGGGIIPNVAAGVNSTITGTTLGYTLNQVVPFTTAQVGSGFDMNNLPTVTVTGGGGTGATILPNWVNGILVSVTVTGLGTGFTAAPVLTFTGGGAPLNPPPGPVNLALLGTTLATVGLPSGGTGYTSAPVVTITGGGGTGATATATISGGSVTGYTLLTPGTGYTGSPTVTLTGGGTNPNSAATASLQTSGNGGNVTVTSSGNLTLAGNVQGGNVFVTAPSINTSGGTINTNGTLSYNATGGNLITGSANARKFVGVTTGNLVQNTTTGGFFTVIANSTDTHVFNATASGNILLVNGNNLTGIVQFLQGRDVTLNTSRPVTVGTTNATGNFAVNTTVSNGTAPVTLGTGGGTAAQSIQVGGNLNITTSNSTIQDDNDTSPFVLGSTNLNTNFFGGGGANIVLNAAANNVTGNVTGRFGQLNANAGTGSLTFSENTLTNVGNIIVGSGSTIRSVNGDIVINGAVTTGAAITFDARTGNITQNPTGTLALGSTSTWNSSNTAGFGTNLSSTTNVFGGAVTIINGNNDIFVAASNFAFTPGNVTSGNLSVTTVNPGNNVTINGGNMTNVTINSAGTAAINGGTIRNLTITANSTATNAIASGGNFTLNGTLTLTTPGNVTIGSFFGPTQVANITGNVVLANVTGDTAIHSARNLTISGNTRGNLTATAGGGSGTSSFANPWPLVFGNLNALSLTAVAGNGGVFIGSNFDPTNGRSGVISQLAGSSLHIENFLNIGAFGADITLTNAGNSAGQVNLNTNGNVIGTGTMGGNLSYMEDSTVKVGGIFGNGTVTLSSAFGGIIEDPLATTNVTSNGLLSLSAPNGSILLGNTTHTVGVTTGNFTSVNLTASGASQLTTTRNLTLGSVNANSFAVTANRITQSAPLNIFGLSSFTATGSLGIVLDNAANNFGPVAINLTALNAPATVVEGNTLNLRSVAMLGGGNGTLSLSSLNGNITDTGLGGVRLGGNATATGSGVVTLNATNGDITIDDPTSDFLTTSGTVFTGKNVTFSILGSGATSLVLGAASASSTASGNLSATSALGSITNAGAFTVTGNAFFQTTTGGISINQPGVNFGTLKFLGNNVSIIEGSDMVILTGSQALGAADLRSGGNISIDNSGGGVVTFGSIAGFLASGNITLRFLQALNTITVTASGTKDMSALSLSTDLNNKVPVDLGAGPGPSTNPALAPKP